MHYFTDKLNYIDYSVYKVLKLINLLKIPHQIKVDAVANLQYSMQNSNCPPGSSQQTSILNFQQNLSAY